MMPSHPKILVSIRESLFHGLFDQDAQRQLGQLGQLSIAAGDDKLTSSELARLLPGCDVVIGGWGMPTFTHEALAAADSLKLIAYAAGTIKRTLPPAVFERGIRVTHAAAALAKPVGETTLLLILLSLRQFHKIDRAFKAGGWAAADAFPAGRELAGMRVGIIGASHTGREAMRRLLAMEAEIWLYDPYLDEPEAAELGARKVELAPLLRGCPIVSLHAPATSETHNMLGAAEFALLQDSAIFINTARAHMVDEAAMIAALQTGRISAAIDVFEQEPLPDDSPLRQLDNVIITPHISAHTRQARRRQGRCMVEEIERYLSGGALRWEITRDMLETMA